MARSRSRTATQQPATEPLPTPSTVRIAGITGHTIDAVWMDVEPYIKSALMFNHGALMPEDVYRALKARDMQLWIAIVGGKMKAAAITEVVVYPQLKNIRIFLLGGDDMPSWVDDMERTFEEWGAAIGAKGIEVVGRTGWKKTLQRFGYKETYRVLHKEICHG